MTVGAKQIAILLENCKDPYPFLHLCCCQDGVVYGDDDGKDEEEVAVYEAEEEHDRRSINCRFAQAVFTTIMAAALLALGKYADKMVNNDFNIILTVLLTVDRYINIQKGIR